jgi:hypothetical protein
MFYTMPYWEETHRFPYWEETYRLPYIANETKTTQVG